MSSPNSPPPNNRAERPAWSWRAEGGGGWGREVKIGHNWLKGSGNPKSEGRNPKEIRNPKAEIRMLEGGRRWWEGRGRRRGGGRLGAGGRICHNWLKGSRGVGRGSRGARDWTEAEGPVRRGDENAGTCLRRSSGRQAPWTQRRSFIYFFRTFPHFSALLRAPAARKG